VPYFLVPIVAADPHRVRGVLALKGITNVGNLSARLQAEDAESAERRVRLALEGELVALREPIQAE
jgi:hypothetical protein